MFDVSGVRLLTFGMLDAAWILPGDRTLNRPPAGVGWGNALADIVSFGVTRHTPDPAALTRVRAAHHTGWGGRAATMTARFDQAVVAAADRLARDPRTRSFLAAVVRTAREQASVPRRPEVIPITSLPGPTRRASSVETRHAVS